MTGGLYLQDALRMRFVLLNSHAMQPVDVLQRFLAIWILQIGAKVEQQDQLIYGTKIFHKLVFALERRKTSSPLVLDCRDRTLNRLFVEPQAFPCVFHGFAPCHTTGHARVRHCTVVGELR